MAPAKKPAGGKPKKKAANGYQMPEPVPPGTVLTDMAKRQWKIGPSIGSGGFGEIYCACEAGSGIKKPDDYPYVVKIEPHGNGPLFVEMHFYMRNAKQEDVEKFKKARGLKHLGMPHFVGNGSHDLQNLKHRFLVMPRYGTDLWGIFLRNEKRFPLQTVYRIALQMVDVLEYIHDCTYVHADLKGANILVGFGKTASKQQLFLVDFGLASHYTTKDFKPDPKKMHNGTIEYTSRDAHQGVPTMRGDMEILAYTEPQLHDAPIETLPGARPFQETNLPLREAPIPELIPEPNNSIAPKAPEGPRPNYEERPTDQKTPLQLNEFGLPPSLIPLSSYNGNIQNPQPYYPQPGYPYNFPVLYDSFGNYNPTQYQSVLPPFGYFPQLAQPNPYFTQNAPPNGPVNNAVDSQQVNRSGREQDLPEGPTKQDLQTSTDSKEATPETEPEADVEATEATKAEESTTVQNIPDSIKNNANKNKDIPDVPPPPIPSGAKEADQ